VIFCHRSEAGELKVVRKNEKRHGYGKVLDAWVPPEDAGEPIGCVATTFTFSPVFFEEECLGRFLKLETDPKEDGQLYLVEREFNTEMGSALEKGHIKVRKAYQKFSVNLRSEMMLRKKVDATRANLS